MYFEKLKICFNEFNNNGLNSVNMIAIARHCGFHITRARLLELVDAEIIGKPVMLNDSLGKGRRMSFDFNALKNLLIHLLAMNLIDGVSNGSRYMGKDRIIVESYRLAESLGNDLDRINSQGSVKSLLLACQLLPSDVKQSQKTHETKKIRCLIMQAASAYAFVKTLLHCTNMMEVIDIWKSYSSTRNGKFINERSIGNDSNFEEGMTKFANQVSVVDKLLTSDKSSLTKDALVACANIFYSLEKDSGWLAEHLNLCFRASFNTTLFVGKDKVDKLLAIAILKLV